MVVWRQETLLLILVPVVGFFSIPAHGQHPRRLGERVIAAQDIPLTNFSCSDRTPGYYADVETGCQVYHMCTEGGQQFSYKCPNTTLFQQRMLICAHWYQVNCSRSEQDYNANLLIGQRDKPFVDDSEQINIYVNNDKDFHPLKNPDDLQRLGTNGNGGGRVQHHHPFIQSTVPDFGDAPRANVTHNIFQTTKPISTNFRQIVSTSTPPIFKTFPTKPPATTNNFVSFNTHFTTTPLPLTDNFEQDFETTTTDYFDENINNVYNSFINRFIPNINDTETNFAQTINPSFTTTSFEDNTVTRGSIERTTTLPTPTTLNINNNSPKQESLYNNFITRFIPDINETDTNVNNDFVQIEHKFLKRFNPDEVVPNFNIRNNVNNFNQQNTPQFINPSAFINFQNLGTNFKSLIPPLQEPSINLELPQEAEDNAHMESNILELKFQDPRQVFFIPDNDNQNIPVENATPITVNIPRQIAQQQLHPMLFINSVPDSCSRCHPSFIVNRSNCSPCVVIR